NEGKRSPFSAACVVKSQFKPTVDWKKYMKKSEKSWFFYKSAQCGLSGYARDILLGKPMIAAYRNQSLQDIMAELSLLRKDLNGIANNFNQAVRKLHVSDTSNDIRAWVQNHEGVGAELLKYIRELHGFINKTAEKWLRS